MQILGKFERFRQSLPPCPIYYDPSPNLGFSIIFPTPPIYSAPDYYYGRESTWVGKLLHLVNFTFTLINEGRRSMRGRGNYCLAIVKGKED